MEDLKVYWGIFWRTFAQLVVPVLLTAQAYDWVNGDKKYNAALLGFGLLVAFVGGVVAAGYAWVKTPATSALQKSLRSAVQAALGVLAALPTNAMTDIVAWPALLWGGVSIIVGAFAVTYFQNQA